MQVKTVFSLPILDNIDVCAFVDKNLYLPFGLFLKKTYMILE